MADKKHYFIVQVGETYYKESREILHVSRIEFVTTSDYDEARHFPSLKEASQTSKKLGGRILEVSAKYVDEQEITNGNSR